MIARARLAVFAPCLVLWLALPAAAQEADLEARRAAAERYLATEGAQLMLAGMTSPEAVVAQLRSQFPAIPEDVVAGIAEIAAEELSAMLPSLERALVEATVTSFTLEEIDAMADFYGSETGAAIMGKMQPYMAAVWAGIGPEMQSAQMAIARRVDEMMATR